MTVSIFPDAFTKYHGYIKLELSTVITVVPLPTFCTAVDAGKHNSQA